MWMQGPRTWAIFYFFSRHVSGKLYQKWSRWDLNWCSKGYWCCRWQFYPLCQSTSPRSYKLSFNPIFSWTFWNTHVCIHYACMALLVSFYNKIKLLKIEIFYVFCSLLYSPFLKQSPAHWKLDKHFQNELINDWMSVQIIFHLGS